MPFSICPKMEVYGKKKLKKFTIVRGKIYFIVQDQGGGPDVRCIVQDQGVVRLS